MPKNYSTIIENDFVGDSNMYMYVSGLQFFLQISLHLEPECINKESIVLFVYILYILRNELLNSIPTNDNNVKFTSIS